MKFTNRRIEVTLSRTINLGNYESFKPQVGLTVDVPDNEDLQEAYDVVYSIVSEQLDKMSEGR
jgi:hypothetical protein